MNIDLAKLEEFTKTARSVVGRDSCTPFSVEDVHSVADKCGLNGVIFLEKLDDGRHVNVLLDLEKTSVTLYDPLLGVKTRPCDHVQLGMYCEPIGSLRTEVQRYQQRSESGQSGGVWAQYEQRGKLIFSFLRGHPGFRSPCTGRASNMADLPALQNDPNSADCAPIALFIISLIEPTSIKTDR